MGASRKLAVAAAAALLLYAGYAALRSWRTGDPDRIRAAISAIETACEEKDVGGVAENISERYHDSDGLGKREIKGFLLQQFLGQKENIAIQRLGATEVQMRGPAAATASFRAAISSGGGGGLGAALRGERWDFDVDFEKERGSWLVVSHRRRPAAP
jgi:hypothetical protein